LYNVCRYPLIIGGIDVPHTRGCVAHSDGDVLLHCITDALLGALSLPDIGQLFPDSDPKWKVSAHAGCMVTLVPVKDRTITCCCHAPVANCRQCCRRL
jgi:2-C-methyl-D-erythritol 2,4-cyclodiphosphate synthase